jgi:hypothetical protein
MVCPSRPGVMSLLKLPHHCGFPRDKEDKKTKTNQEIRLKKRNKTKKINRNIEESIKEIRRTKQRPKSS